MFDYVWVALLVPIVGIVATAAVVIFALERVYKIRSLDHDAKLKAIEKGYDVPIKRPRPQYPYAWPLVLLCFGLALILIFVINAIDGSTDTDALGFGLVVFFIGGGLLASRFISVRRQDEETDARRTAQVWRSPDPATAPAAGGEATDPMKSTDA